MDVTFHVDTFMEVTFISPWGFSEGGETPLCCKFIVEMMKFLNQ